MMTKKVKSENPIFLCKVCNYECSKKYLYEKHILTRKHQMMTNGDNIQDTAFICSCGKQFSYRQGLHRHKKICQKVTIEPNNLNSAAVVELLKQNTEFKQLIIEQNKVLQEQNKSIMELASKETTVNNHCTNNNQKFNLNFFLNTTCKDAINLSEFVENMNIEFEDIENIGRQGYVAGMSDMILSRIKNMDITKRPVHCTDLKRETMYIKDNDTWNKDTPENKKLRTMIDIVAAQNYGKMPSWMEKYPDCLDTNHAKYDFSINMMKNVLGDVGEEQIKLNNKVVKNIAKHIIIEK